MRNGSPKFSVVIPTCGRESLLACLRGLANQSYADFEVVAVDDGSPQPVASMAGIREIPVELRILRQENAGPAAARNAGAAEARGEFLAFTDDDCIPDPGWLAALARELEAHPDALCGSLSPTTASEIATGPARASSSLISFTPTSTAIRRTPIFSRATILPAAGACIWGWVDSIRVSPRPVRRIAIFATDGA